MDETYRLKTALDVVLDDWKALVATGREEGIKGLSYDNIATLVLAAQMRELTAVLNDIYNEEYR